MSLNKIRGRYAILKSLSSVQGPGPYGHAPEQSPGTLRHTEILIVSSMLVPACNPNYDYDYNYDYDSSPALLSSCGRTASSSPSTPSKAMPPPQKLVLNSDVP